MIFEESLHVRRPFDEVVAEVKSALAEQGFGVLTEIDLQATFDAKIGKRIDKHLIIGACNPHLASMALDAVPELGVLLPCNVAVRQVDDGVIVEAMDPGVMSQMVDNPEVASVAAQARTLVSNAMRALME